MATFKAVVFQGGRHLKKDGTTNVKIRVYHNSSAQYIPTEYFIEPDLMNEDGSISSLSANSENLNYEITNLVQKYRGAYIKLGSLSFNCFCYNSSCKFHKINKFTFRRSYFQYFFF